MTTVSDVFMTLAKLAPPEMKMDFDNVGLLVGREETEVARALIALDITDAVIEEAVKAGAQLIVSHHPMFFSLKSVTDGDRTGRKIVRLLSSGISAICMHTNLDAARGGVNDALAEKVGILNPELLTSDGVLPSGEAFSYGRFGELKVECGLGEYLAFLKDSLKSNGLRYCGGEKPVKRVAVLGGSGGDYMHEAIARGCDTFITSDIKYDVFLEAKELGINLIDADHFCTENVVVERLKKWLGGEFPEITADISKQHVQTAQFF